MENSYFLFTDFKVFLLASQKRKGYSSCHITDVFGLDAPMEFLPAVCVLLVSFSETFECSTELFTIIFPPKSKSSPKSLREKSQAGCKSPIPAMYIFTLDLSYAVYLKQIIAAHYEFISLSWGLILIFTNFKFSSKEQHEKNKLTAANNFWNSWCAIIIPLKR